VAVCEVRRWFPCVVIVAVSLPFDEKHVVSSDDFEVEYRFNLEMFVAVDDVRRWLRVRRVCREL
jgi:NADPH-dependent 7-cyano-7-deazaguanine reductase QueF-like protein